MYLKKRDKDILHFIEDWKSANATIIGNMFFSDCKESRYNASRRLKVLMRNGFLKKYKKDIYSETIYYRGNKPLTDHQMKLLEVYSHLNMLGDNVTLEREVTVPCANKNRKNDGMVTMTREDDEYLYEYAFIIEIDATHNTNASKIKQVSESSYYTDRFGIVPTWIIVKRNEFQNRYYVKGTNIIYLNWNLEGLDDRIFELDNE